MANQIGYRLQLMHSVSRAGWKLPSLVSKSPPPPPAGVRLYERNRFYLFFIRFHKLLLTANQAISNHRQTTLKKQTPKNKSSTSWEKPNCCYGNIFLHNKMWEILFWRMVLFIFTLCPLSSLSVRWSKVWQIKLASKMDREAESVPFQGEGACF